MRSKPEGEKSLEWVLAERWPKKTRMPMALEPDSFSVSTCPRRTKVENSSPSRMTHSAELAPPETARRTKSWASSFRSVSIWGSTIVSDIGKPAGCFIPSEDQLLHEAARVAFGGSPHG